MTNDTQLLNKDILLQVLALSKDATAVYSSAELTIEFATDTMIAFWGKDRSIIGMPLGDAVPELKGQPFLDLLRNVWITGETYQAQDTPAELLRDGHLQTFYFDFEYRAIKNADGKTYALLHTATEVTERLKALERVKISERKEQELNTELAATNKELQAVNDDYFTVNKELYALNEEYQTANSELAATNKQLNDAYTQLNDTTDTLKLTEARARLLLEQAPVAIGLIDATSYAMLSANELMIDLWDLTRQDIGKPLTDILPPATAENLLSIIEEVKTTGAPVYGYEIDTLRGNNEQREAGYHNFVYQPLKDSKGKVYNIMVVANDITEQSKLKRQIQYSEQRLIQMIGTAPLGMTILKSRDLIIEVANEPMFKIWGRTREQTIGHKILDVFPELLDQPFPQMLASIFETGERIAISEIPVDISDLDGSIRKIYVNFTYDPMLDEDGNVEAIVAAVIDITEIVETRQKLEESEAALQQFNEELSAVNEEQEAANEELLATNEELAAAQHEIQRFNNKLIESENRIRSILEQAPLGMCVLSGPEHMIEIANESILKIWGRTEEEVLGKPHHLARPELDGQPVYEWLDAVYHTGITKVNNEFRVMLYNHGTLREAYVNSIYQPLRNANDEVIGIMVLIDEITDKVKARLEAQRVQEMFSIAVEAGELGTFYYDPLTNRFSGNELLRSWFGLKPEENFDLNIATDCILDTDRQRVIDAITYALDPASGGKYDIEYTIVNPLTQEHRIVKAKGKTLFDEHDHTALSLNGTLLDITERKKDEQRKNDFIGMVSHELKTPLTSLKAYLQILQARALKANDSFTSGALEKADNQVKKMTGIINGFLNVTRLESGKIHIDKQHFALGELIKETDEEISATVSGHTVIFECTEELIVEADRDKIGQVINNLVSNAVKYSPNGSHIEVKCAAVNDQAVISVSDNGMGIKEQDIEKLFDRYYRVEGEMTHTISGFGIGLYLSAEIIQRHNGRIWVESEYGKGSTFYFSLPL
ncbi:PAS domain-containing protein [Mucilaginibacter daejeonensis]|uniref:PAS domain S-box protein n=1 Tax=Mucilaginibacter daejeonensis TaxID=398049 RepID=UPI001D1723B4|nr:PAS domain S-box protein [Mucilaginibacter daejeonensis]UEG54628.1 PAS domain-containing protein [Mucilaginibacter daejeonensis]